MCQTLLFLLFVSCLRIPELLRKGQKSHVISDGLGPFYRRKLEDKIRNKVLAYSLIVDEATTAAYWKQFDIIVRFWDPEVDKVYTSHFHSFTLGHADSETLKNCIVDAITSIYPSKLIQISTDGPMS